MKTGTCQRDGLPLELASSRRAGTVVVVGKKKTKEKEQSAPP
jgi:hypothetical protein